MQGFLDSALVVGSFHMLDRLGEEGPERVVRSQRCRVQGFSSLVTVPPVLSLVSVSQHLHCRGGYKM